MKRFWRKKRVRSLPQIGELPLTPLIDTAFTLLIIFMVTAPMMQNSLKINLPKARAGANQKNAVIERVTVNIDAKGQVFVGDKLVALNNLSNYLSAKINIAIDKTVLVKADKTLVYDQVIQVIDLVGGVDGVQSVALATELANKKI